MNLRPNRPLSGLVLLAVFLAAAIARADDRVSRFESFFTPGNSASYSVSLEPAGSERPQVLTQGARANAVVSSTTVDTWSVNGRAEHTAFSHSVAVPASGLALPDSLYDLQAGTAYRRNADRGRQWGVQGAVGSASDKPFHSIHETEFQATANLLVPSGARNSWILFLTYSNNRTFANNVPLPGFAYVARAPERGVQAIVGFPFLLIRWTPDRDWTVRGALFGPETQSLDVARRLSGPLFAFAALDHGAQTWFRAGRETLRDRTIYEEKKAVAGLRANARGVSMEVSAGPAFGRRIFEAKNVNSAGASKVHLTSGWVLFANLGVSWGGISKG